jgi:DNA-directed RNA polymerase subunit RPC12/RpoP
MIYRPHADGECPDCGGRELVEARDELAIAPTTFDDLAQCLACGAFVPLDPADPGVYR